MKFLQNLIVRHSFWNKIIQSGQIGLSGYQGVSLSTEKDISATNIVIACIQGALAIVSLWTADANKNDIIDIAEPVVDVTITSNTPINVKTEINENKES